MSERSSFVSEYIYNDATYKILREHMETLGNNKYWCIAPPCKYDEFVLPIIAGKIGTLTPNYEGIEMGEALCGIKTPIDVKFVVVCEAGDIQLVTKDADGDVLIETLMVNPDDHKFYFASQESIE